MRKVVSTLLIITGVLILTISIYQFYQQKISTNKTLDKAQQLVFKRDGQAKMVDQFSPKENDVIGVLNIPKLERSLPIIEGTDEEMLEKGVGHYSSTMFPGQDEQILLSGHRDTVFRKFGELEIGDRLIVEMPYGEFEYEIRKTEIVASDNTTVIGPKGEEVLTVSTCYPFSYIGTAPDRYIIYAYPMKHLK
ncbi:class D sortase [Cytobacillus pseudoceanisediminis]|uniref:class D sortase n=1 Tax=Cytobacillus pseudoceanisediminis TaxID=3051614 RepID=UPI003C2C152C